MIGAFILMAMVACMLLACLLAVLIDLKRKREQLEDLALLQGTCDTWRETATRRADELAEACKQRFELHDALYLSKDDSQQATHQQAVDRAKRLVVIARNYEILGFDIANIKDAIFGKDKPALPSIREATLVAAEHREKSAKWDSACNDIHDLQRDRGSWRALRREIADCCGKPVPETEEPPNHAECVAMLRGLQEKSDNFRSETIEIDCGEMMYYCPCGRILPGGSLCNCKVCRESRANLKSPDHSEPLSPAMGVGEVTKDDFHRAAVEKFKVGFVESKSLVFPTADSIENAPADFPLSDLPADFAIDRMLASAEARSNSYG